MKKLMATGCWFLACACGGQPAAPAGPAAAAQSTGGEAQAVSPPPLPAAREATFTQPVHIPLQLLATAINGQLPDHETQPRSLLTRENASPAIEGEVEVWRDAVSVSFDGETLHAEVPLRYAARFSARVKNPFGGKWLKVAQDEPWGTAEEPQRATLRVHTRVEITPQWELHLHTEVDAPEHGPPPGGELCTSGIFKLCITKDSFAPEVRRRLEAELVPRIREELEKLDRQIEEKVELRARAERLWRALPAPRALGAYDRYTTLMPQRAGLELHAADDEIVIEPAVFGTLTTHQGTPPALEAPPLPDKQPLAELPPERSQDDRLFSLDALM